MNARTRLRLARIQQDMFRACQDCAGAVATKDGELGCALIKRTHRPFDCVLPRAMARARAGEVRVLGVLRTNWIMEHKRTEGPVLPGEDEKADEAVAPPVGAGTDEPEKT